MRYFGIMLGVCLLAGCQTPMQSGKPDSAQNSGRNNRPPKPRDVPRGQFFLPEDSFLTVKRVEALVPPGMPIEQAREVMEIHGFVCTFEESVDIPYLQCNQIKYQHLWPFNGNWMATIYYEHGLVKSVQARYDLNPVELGTRVPKRAALEAREIDSMKDAKAKGRAPSPGAVAVPVDDDVMYIEPATVVPDAPPPPIAPSAQPADEFPAENGPPASVPVEIP